MDNKKTTLQSVPIYGTINAHDYRNYLVMRKRALKMELGEIERQLKRTPKQSAIAKTIPD
jgi:hypothetical protein